MLFNTEHFSFRKLYRAPTDRGPRQRWDGGPGPCDALWRPAHNKIREVKTFRHWRV